MPWFMDAKQHVQPFLKLSTVLIQSFQFGKTVEVKNFATRDKIKNLRNI